MGIVRRIYMLITSGSERVKFVNIEIFRISRMVFETLKSDQYLISPYSNAVKPFIKIMRIKEMIGNLPITITKTCFFFIKTENLAIAKGKSENHKLRKLKTRELTLRQN